MGDGKVGGVELDSGEHLTADIYVAATGVRPNLEFLASSGIEHHWGITVDDSLRTSAPRSMQPGMWLNRLTD